MNKKNTTIRQSAVQNMAGEYNTTARSPAHSVAVNAVNGVNAANAAKPPDMGVAAATTAASPAFERRFQPLVPLKGQVIIIIAAIRIFHSMRTCAINHKAIFEIQSQRPMVF